MSSSPSTNSDSPTAEQAQEISKQVGQYVKVGLLSVVITCLTVFFSFVTHGSIPVAMLLATINALFIAYFTMHLKSEKASIQRTVFLSLFFFTDLFLVTLLAVTDRIHL